MRWRTVLAAAAAGLAAACAAPHGVVSATTHSSITLPHRLRPLAVVVGDSYAAGTGTEPQRSWSHLLGPLLGWDVITYAVPGSGYVAEGDTGEGRYSQQLATAGLDGLRPDVVIVEGGHNDVRFAPSAVHRAAVHLFDQIRTATPGTKIIAVGMFWPSHPELLARARATDAALRSAATGLTYVDPLAAGWRYPTIRDHLHPTPAGHEDIARDVAAAIEAVHLKITNTR